MAWKALVPPRLGTQDMAGRCLPFAQSFFGAPIRYDYAFEAWQATQHKGGVNAPIPDVPVLLWFSHWGTYYSHSRGVWEYVNAGHVVVNVPGDAIYSSPTNGFGSQRFGTVQQIERAFNATYVGWSLDINGLLVAAWEEDDDMYSDQDRARDTETRKLTGEVRDLLARNAGAAPLLAMKLDNGSMHGLGVMYEPDGTVTGLTRDQWGFWTGFAGCQPVRCTVKGQWEYLAGVMAARRKRAGIVVSDADVAKIAKAVSDSVTGVTAEQVAAALQVTVKP